MSTVKKTKRTTQPTPITNPANLDVANQAIRHAFHNHGENRGVGMMRLDQARLRLTAAHCIAWASEPEDWADFYKHTITQLVDDALDAVHEAIQRFAMPAEAAQDVAAPKAG